MSQDVGKYTMLRSTTHSYKNWSSPEDHNHKPSFMSRSESPNKDNSHDQVVPNQNHEQNFLRYTQACDQFVREHYRPVHQAKRMHAMNDIDFDT